MIRIKRGPVPEALQLPHVEEAKKQLQEIFENANRQHRLQFNTEIIALARNPLLQVTQNKCAYCESALMDYEGHVDHFRPKSGARGMTGEYAPNHYWWLAYDWNNLLVSCQVCNKHKRDIFPVETESKRAPIGATGEALFSENALIVDPGSEDPSVHLGFLDNGLIEPKSKKGECTIAVLGLNRDELVQKRLEAANSFRLRLINSQEADPSAEIEAEIRTLVSDNPPQEYVATLMGVLAGWLPDNRDRLSGSTLRFVLASNNFIKSRKIIKDALPDPVSKSEVKDVFLKSRGIRRFSIKSIEIQNFKSIEYLPLEILPAGSDKIQEPWLLVLGDNGIGKSTILQAIALALAGYEELERLQPDVNDYLRHGTSSGYIRIRAYEQDEPIELRFDASGFHTDLVSPPTFLMAYGSTRLLPMGPIQPELFSQPFVNIGNLFDYSIALSDPHTWLKELDEKEFSERVAPAFFDLLALRGDDRLSIENGKIKITQYGFKNDLEDNSDGYKTVVALVTDIMKSISLDKGGYHNAQGIVLIDEIGNHLHPRWRMKIVSALRRTFPYLQFIVTTHEPLCLRGMAHGEVVVLVRDDKRKIRALDKSLLPDHSMMRIDQLLTSDLFGLINIMDEEAEKTYEEYYRLLSKAEDQKTNEDLQKIQEIKAIIDEKEVLGNTPEEQVMYKVIDQEFAKKIREDGFKTKEELKQETVEAVKSFLKTEKYDWL